MEAICFDLDGTLTDPWDGIVRSIRYALDRLDVGGLNDEDDLTWCIGPPLLASFQTILGSADAAQEALMFYRERFAEVGLYENEVYAGIPEVLEALTDSKRLFVATSKPTVFAEIILSHFGLSDAFEAIYGSELDGTRSDKTELLAWILKRKGLDPERTTMVGDRRQDIAGALANGMNAVGVLYGYGTQTELESAGANRFCSRVGELIELLG